MTKNIAEQYKILDAISAVRLRPGMYIGTVVPTTGTSYVYDTATQKMVNREITFIPALVKVFSEILDNAIDEYKRHPDIMDTIRVNISDTEISVADNGAGIPVQIHPETGKYVAETIFTTIHAGSNFTDSEDQQLAGMNGFGSTGTAIMSTEFHVESCDGKQVFRQTYLDGLRTIQEPSIRKSSKNGTKITFTPDFAYFKMTHLDADHQAKLIKRVIDAAACNPTIKFYINDERLQVKSFSDYVNLYTNEFEIDVNQDWTVAVTASDGFEQISFVNSLETYTGGTHVDYVANQLVASIREHIKKKHKVDVKPSDIKSHIRLFISCNINRPKFNSQTKEFMTSQVSEYKTSWTAPDKFVNKILKSEIIQSVLAWAQAKQQAIENAELAKKNKDASKINPKHVDKFADAVSKNERYLCEVYITEGLSAQLSIKSAGGKNPYIGSFALKGKPKNVDGLTDKQIYDNEEFRNFLIATGLDINESALMPDGEWVLINDQVFNMNDLLIENGKEVPVASKSYTRIEEPTEQQMRAYIKSYGEKHVRIVNGRFQKFIILSDYDNDGHHIAALMFNFFNKYWPELFANRSVYRFNTPLYIAQVGKVNHEFFTVEEYEEWAKKAPKHKAHYFKGLGTFDTKYFASFLANPDKYKLRVLPIRETDVKRLELAFGGKQANARKEWLVNVNYFNVED